MEYIERKSNLVVPEGFVELDREEMTYVDGGFYISNQDIYNILLVCGMNPVGTVLLGVGYYKLCQWIAGLGAKLGLRVGGMIGGIVGAVVGLAIGALAFGYVAGTFADALLQGKGIEVDWKKTWFGMIYGVGLTVK